MPVDVDMRIGERGAGHDKPRPATRLRSQPGVADEVGGTITVQGEVTGNFRVNRALGRERSKNSEKAGLRGPMEVYGGNIDQLQIKQHDLVWAQKNPERTGQTGKKTPAKTGVCFAMASMTGIATKTRDILTQEDWEDMFWVPGRAKADWSFKDPSNGAGVAVQMRGSCTIRNNGNATFYPGDYIAWKSWNIDPDIRATELHNVRRNNGEPQGKLGVLLRRVTFEDIHRLPHSALTRYFKRRKDASHSAFLRTDYHNVLGDMALESKDRFFLHNMRAESSLGLLLNIATGVQSGLISINLTGNASQDRAILAEYEKLSAEQLVNNAYKIGGPNGTKFVEVSEMERQLTWDKFVMLGKALGVIGVTSEPGTGAVPHLHHLVEANILRTNRGLMNQPDTYGNQGDYAISRMAPKPDQLMAFQSMSKSQTAEIKLDHLQRDYAVKKYSTYSEAEHHARKNIFALCYKASEPGMQMDVIL